VTDSMNALQGAKVLLVDDQPANLDVLCDLLEARGCSILLAPSGGIALQTAGRAMPDVILLDIMMPEIDGFETCRRLKANPDTAGIPVIFITARDMKEDVVAGLDAGGVDYVTKPFQEEEVVARVETHVRVSRLATELATRNEELVEKNDELEEKNDQLEAEIGRRRKLKGQLSGLAEREADLWELDGFVGQSPTMREIFDHIRLLQENPGMSVLIAGESGTGKELIARAIHSGGARRDAPFVPVNCAAMPGELAESLLFGHMRGAFTGADRDRLGYFEMADGGTLFLDEIGDMPKELQGKLLRVLEDSQVWRVGDSAGRQVDVRVLAASNVDLQAKIQEGGFRQDLYFRVARFSVTAPPLRQRVEDIPLLAEHFLRLLAKEMGCDHPEISAKALDRLQSYPFPGNVRELKNVVERALIECRCGLIEPQHLHLIDGALHAAATGVPNDLPMDLDEAADQARLAVLHRAMDLCSGNVSEAARQLGTSRNKVYRLLEQERQRHTRANK
jgi:DNA-binding NtrC family response regulator